MLGMIPGRFSPHHGVERAEPEQMDNLGRVGVGSDGVPAGLFSFQAALNAPVNFAVELLVTSGQFVLQICQRNYFVFAFTGAPASLIHKFLDMLGSRLSCWTPTNPFRCDIVHDSPAYSMAKRQVDQIAASQCLNVNIVPIDCGFIECGCKPGK